MVLAPIMQKAGFSSSGMHLPPESAKGSPSVVFSSLTQDATGGRFLRFTRFVGELEPTLYAVDYPRGAELRQGCRELSRLGYSLGVHEMTCTRKRQVTTGHTTDLDPAEQHPDRCAQRSRATGVKPFLSSPADVDPGLWLTPAKFNLEYDPRIRTTGNKLLPWAIGIVTSRDAPKPNKPFLEAEKKAALPYLVYDASGPVHTVRTKQEHPIGNGVCLIHQAGGSGLEVRPLTGLEVWKIQGGTAKDWACALKCSVYE